MSETDVSDKPVMLLRPAPQLTSRIFSDDAELKLGFIRDRLNTK